MDREALKNQIIEFEKRMIKVQGLQWWLKEQACQPDEIKNRESYRRRCDYLLRWARENGLDGSIPESNSDASEAKKDEPAKSCHSGENRSPETYNYLNTHSERNPRPSRAGLASE